MVWSMAEVGSQTGKTFLITGSNTGIGFATARLLAGKRAKIIMACRNTAKGELALKQLKSMVPGADCTLMALDLASLKSVRSFADRVNTNYPRLDVLINNAGVMIPPLGRTEDGFETQFGTNVLGHFALTGLLLPLLNRTPHARVVTMASIAHWPGRINFDNLNAEQGYSKAGAYAQSKLANLMFAYELQRRLHGSGADTISLAAHPGGSHSELSRHSLILKLLSHLAQSVDDGALPSIRAAVDGQAQGGEYYGPRGIGTIAGAPIRQRSSRRSHDLTVAARLWAACETLTGLPYLSSAEL